MKWAWNISNEPMVSVLPDTWQNIWEIIPNPCKIKKKIKIRGFRKIKVYVGLRLDPPHNQAKKIMLSTFVELIIFGLM